jgi:hypothetical protein
MSTHSPQEPSAEPGGDDVKAVSQLRAARERLRQEIGRVIVGGRGPGRRRPDSQTDRDRPHKVITQIENR